MLHCIIFIMSSMFEFLRNFLGFADSASRKRSSTTTVNGPTQNKRQRMIYNNLQNGRNPIEVDIENDDDVLVCNEIKSNNHNNHHLCQNKRNTVTNCQDLGFNAIKNTFAEPVFKKNMEGFSAKHNFNSRSYIPRKHSTMGETYRLREKAQYNQLLKNFLPPNLSTCKHVPKKVETSKPIEVIELDKDDFADKPNSLPSKSLGSPIKWSTPLNKVPSKFSKKPLDISIIKPLKSPVVKDGDKFIEEIKIDDSDSESSSTSTLKSKQHESASTRSFSAYDGIKTNSLKDRLSSKAVLKNDYIPRIKEHYQGKIDKKSKEAEEVSAEIRRLSEQNRYLRSFSLEEQLARSMKLNVPVIEEDYEEEDVLPELTQSMMNEVKDALVPRPADQVLAEAFGLRITRKDMNTLVGLNWLNDEVINFYMNLLIDRGGNNNFPSVHAFNTFFYPKLLSGGHASLKRWTRKIDIFSKDIVAVPIHLGMHWCMAIIDFRDKSIRYYDSMGAKNQKCLLALKKYLEDESLDKRKTKYDTSNWTLESMADIPQQMNGSDCGVFSCTFAEFICANRKLNFSQDNMPYFRSKMVYEILKKKLL